MKKLIIYLIRLYQHLPLSSHGLCRFQPTCSQYMIDCITKFGIIKGLFLGVKRILRCNPLGGYGSDPIPDQFSFFKRK